jgi:hypothetical protein
MPNLTEGNRVKDSLKRIARLSKTLHGNKSLTPKEEVSASLIPTYVRSVLHDLDDGIRGSRMTAHLYKHINVLRDTQAGIAMKELFKVFKDHETLA